MSCGHNFSKVNFRSNFSTSLASERYLTHGEVIKSQRVWLLSVKPDDDDFVINVFRRQGCPHLGQGHGPIVSSRHRI